jgi:hypothetical protein
LSEKEKKDIEEMREIFETIGEMGEKEWFLTYFLVKYGGFIEKAYLEPIKSDVDAIKKMLSAYKWSLYVMAGTLAVIMVTFIAYIIVFDVYPTYFV